MNYADAFDVVEHDPELVEYREAELLAAGAAARARLIWLRDRAAGMLGRSDALYREALDHHGAASFAAIDRALVVEAEAHRIAEALLGGLAAAIVEMRGE